MDIVHVSSKGQIVIPEAVRKKLRIVSGTRLVVTHDGKRFTLQREQDAEEALAEAERRETEGWTLLGEETLKDIWSEPEEDVWNSYAKTT